MTQIDVAPYLPIWANNTPPPRDKPESNNLVVFLQFGEITLPSYVSWDQQLGAYKLDLVDILNEDECRPYKIAVARSQYFYLRREIKRLVHVEVTPGISVKNETEPMKMPKGLRALQVTLVETKH